MKSTIQLNPYLNFGGQCEKAMQFYQQCFGGELVLQRVSESSIAEQCPEGIQHQILHSTLKADSLILMGTDMTGKEKHITGSDIAIALHGTDLEIMGQLFIQLSQSGEIIEEWSKKPWGDYFGVLKDQFGKRWMMNCSIAMH